MGGCVLRGCLGCSALLMALAVCGFLTLHGLHLF